MMSRFRPATGLAALAAVTLLACHGPAPRLEPVASAERAAPAGSAPSAAPSAEQALARLIELARTDNRVQQHLEHLCLDIGPRLTGSSRLQRALEWTRDEFLGFGLDARLEAWGDFPVGFDRGPWRGGMVAPRTLDFEFHTMAWSPGTDGPKRGPALAFPSSEEELEALGDRIRGAWLVRPPSAALKDEAGTVVFEKPTQPSTALIKKVEERIVALGGLGEVRGARGDLLVTDGNHRITFDELPKLVQPRVRKDHHDQLWAELQKGPVELEFDIDNRFVPGPIPQYNVIADLRGAEKPDEMVIVSGHLDSWDGAQGTVDNGTGCATTLEAARLLTAVGARPARTIRFILWTGEEQGLFGSQAYVKSHADELPRVSVVLVHDEGTNYLSGLGVPAPMLAQLRDALAPLADLDPEYPFELAEVEGLPTFVGSDNDSFTQVGVPGLFWRQSGRSEYEHHHHTQYDTFDAAIPEYQRHSALVVAIAALRVADLPELLDRTDMKAPEPRRMGVQLDSTKLTEVSEGSRAQQAGLQPGDVILAIDGQETKTQARVSASIREGGPLKVFKMQRGEEVFEVTLDWSSDPDEPRRQKQAELRAKRDAEREAARQAAREARAAAEKGDADKGEDGSKP